MSIDFLQIKLLYEQRLATWNPMHNLHRLLFEGIEPPTHEQQIEFQGALLKRRLKIQRLYLQSSTNQSYCFPRFPLSSVSSEASSIEDFYDLHQQNKKDFQIQTESYQSNYQIDQRPLKKSSKRLANKSKGHRMGSKQMLNKQKSNCFSFGNPQLIFSSRPHASSIFRKSHSKSHRHFSRCKQEEKESKQTARKPIDSVNHFCLSFDHQTNRKNGSPIKVRKRKKNKVVSTVMPQEKPKGMHFQTKKVNEDAKKDKKLEKEYYANTNSIQETKKTKNTKKEDQKHWRKSARKPDETIDDKKEKIKYHQSCSELSISLDNIKKQMNYESYSQIEHKFDGHRLTITFEKTGQK